MFIKFVGGPAGTREVDLETDKCLTIGRSPEADITVDDDEVSRVHCGIRFWDEDCVIKDFKSRNGTFVNDLRVEIAQIRPGDVVKVGETTFVLEEGKAKGAGRITKGPSTIIREIKQEMEHTGKGYKTMLKEIVGESRKDRK